MEKKTDKTQSISKYRRKVEAGCMKTEQNYKGAVKSKKCAPMFSAGPPISMLPGLVALADLLGACYRDET